MTMARRALVHAVCAAVSLASSTALANGRFPRSERLIENSKDPNQLAIAATYGIVTTKDRGKTWYHVCEGSFAGDPAYIGDPLLDRTADGTLIVGVQRSLNVSHDDGCQWSPTLTVDGGAQIVLDHTISASSPSTIVALVTTYQGAASVNTLLESNDNGTTFHAIGTPLPVDFAFSVDLDPKDPSHIYATGRAMDGTGRFVASSDHGATWTAHDIGGVDVDAAAYIAAIHPTDSNKIFVRTDAAKNHVAGDSLFYSSDGGATWQAVYQSHAKMFGFALSPDGSTVLVGLGNPVNPTVIVTGAVGIFKSPVDHFAFEPIFDGPIGCLRWTKTGLYVCGSESVSHFELAFAPNADFAADGGCLTPLLHLSQIKGTLACGQGTTTATCDWNTACVVLGACGDAGPPLAPSCSGAPDAGGGGGAGQGGTAGAGTGTGGPDGGTAGGGGAGGTSSTSAGGVSTGTGGTGGSSGCGCRTASSSDGHALYLAAFGVAAAMVRLIRRRPRGRGAR